MQNNNLPFNSKIEAEYAKLSKLDKLNLAASIYGFKSMPPTIEQFVMDDYFLGMTFKKYLYPYWLDQLWKVYPNPVISPYKYVIATGAIGTGKTSFSVISALYDLCKLFYMTDPYEIFKLDPTTKFTFRAFNLSKGKAYDVIIRKMEEAINRSPFFTEVYRDMESKTRPNLPVGLFPARSSNDVISECLVHAILSEINFFNGDVADDIISTCDSRMTGRLKNVDSVFGKIIFDSSSTLDESAINRFESKCKTPEKILKIVTRIWDAKKHEANYFRLGSFDVYAGSEGIKPHIIAKDEDTSNFDKERVITAPEELRSNFELDIEKALNELAGISLNSQDDFFTDKSVIDRCAILPQVIDQIIVLDFFDEIQLYDIIGEDLLKLLPKDRKVYGSMDMGLKSDLCGMAISYIDEAKYIKIGTKKVFTPKIKCPIAFALSRKAGEETSIEKIINFWIWLSTVRDIGMITTDQFQSASVLQALTKASIPNRRISTVRNDKVYVDFKNMMSLGRVLIPNSKLLKHELYNLQRMGPNNIDHKSTSSKDISDAVSSSIQAILDAGEASAEVPTINILADYNRTMNKLLKVRAGQLRLNSLRVNRPRVVFGGEM